MRVLLIGGTGLIGSSIVPLLLDRGDDVTVISRGGSHRAPMPGSRHIVGDRSRPEFVDLIRGEPMFDCVVDMICYHPAEAETAVQAFSGRTGQYILTSTIDVYRKPATRYPYTEDEPYGGIGVYAANKVACEEIVFAAHRQSGFPVTVIRPAATYGDRHLPVHTLGRSTTYLDRLARGKPIVVHGDGSSFWVSCHASDVARAFAGAVGNETAIGRAYHAAGEEWVTWDEHHRLLAEAIGAPVPDSSTSRPTCSCGSPATVPSSCATTSSSTTSSTTAPPGATSVSSTGSPSPRVCPAGTARCRTPI